MAQQSVMKTNGLTGLKKKVGPKDFPILIFKQQNNLVKKMWQWNTQHLSQVSILFQELLSCSKYSTQPALFL